MKERKINLLGATGSIGKQTLALCRRHPEIKPINLTAKKNYKALAAAAREFGVKAVCIGNEELYKDLCTELADTDVKVLAGISGISELAAETGLAPEEIASAELASGSAQSLNGQTGEEGFSLEQVLTAGNPEEDMIEHIALAQALEQLGRRDRLVIELRYFHGLTQERIAGIIGVSQVQVSRIEKKALGLLRQYF